MNKSSELRLGAIDGLRCIAMSGVVAQHCGILPFGWTGVWLFFVISGYVVTRSIGSLNARDLICQRIFIFYRKRAVRILPPYVLFLAIGVLFGIIQFRSIEWRALFSLVLFYNNFEVSLGQGFMKHWPTGHLWTISVEMQFYMLFGILLVTLKARAMILVLCGTIIAGPVIRCLLSWYVALQDFDNGSAAYIIYTASFAHFDAFSLGSIAALIPNTFVNLKNRTIVLLVACLAFAIYCILEIKLNYTEGLAGLDPFRNIISGNLFGRCQEVFVYSVVSGIAFAILIEVVYHNGRLTRTLEHPILRFIGERSYGAYLFHAAVLAFLEPSVATFSSSLPLDGDTNIVRGPILFLVAYPLTIALAVASYKWLERPVRRFNSRLMGRLSERQECIGLRTIET